MIIPTLVGIRESVVAQTMKYVDTIPNLTNAKKQLLSDLDRILLTLDGDYPQIEVIMANIQQFGERHNVEFMKHSAGCSLIQQALDLDLSKGFWHWRSKLGIPPLSPAIESELPPWCKVVRQTLINHKMDKASVELYIQTYFARIPELFPECFSKR